MKGNNFGRVFRIATWGESHGPALGVLIDGCPAGIELNPADFEQTMTMRQGGQGTFSTPRKEPDQVLIESGVFEGKTTGTPISLRIENKNVRSTDYEKYRHTPRPGHADFTTYKKHGIRDHRGGGRASARETVARAAAGVIAQKILLRKNIEVMAFVQRIGSMEVDPATIPFHGVSTAEIFENWWPRIARLRNKNPLRLPLADISKFEQLIENTKKENDSLGGSIHCWIRGLAPGLGEPTFDKLNAILSHALMSLPAAVSVEIGGGKKMSELKGSEIRDPIIDNQVQGNRHGGLLGGMTSGAPLWTALHFHAPTSIAQVIQSCDQNTGEKVEINVQGRHDCAPLPRAVPMVEAMVMIALVDAIALDGKL